MGLGTENIIKIASDKNGKLIPSELEKALEKCKLEGKDPFICIPTLGTTVLGAIDPVDDIVEICKKHGVWVHVDGSFGGSMLFAGQNEYCKRINEIDSFTLDMHKVT